MGENSPKRERKNRVLVVKIWKNIYSNSGRDDDRVQASIACEHVKPTGSARA